MKRLFSLLAALLLCVFTAGCARETAPGTTAETATEETATLPVDNEAAVDAFLAQIRAGVYDNEKLFDYEDLSQFFTLGDYKGLTYPDDPSYLGVTVTDEEVDDQLYLILLNNVVTDDAYTKWTEGTVQKFDVAHLSYEGYIDGALQDNATTGAEGADLIIGSGNYIDGFEDGLLGCAIGSTVDLYLHFSPYYGDDTVAGKDIHFVVTIESVQRPALPELTAEVINQIYGTGFADLDSVRAALKADIITDKESRAQSSLSGYLQEKIIAQSTVVSYPEKELRYYRDHFDAYFQQYADGQNLSLDDYLAAQGLTRAEYESRREDYAKASCDTDLMVFSVARAEGIVPEDEQVKALILGLLENSEDFSDADGLISYYVSVYGPYYFENRIISASVSELVVKAAVQEGANTPGGTT